jgi:hypothetical protein
MIEPTIRVTKKFEVSLRSATTPWSITVAQLCAGIPGGLTYWNRVRFEKFDIWNNSALEGQTQSGPLAISIAPDSTSGQPPFQLVDNGTVGNRRSGVGFRLGLLERARFYGTADTTVIFTVQSGSSVLVQVTMELLSPIDTTPALLGH